jgi:hypothetical protein
VVARRFAPFVKGFHIILVARPKYSRYVFHEKYLRAQSSNKGEIAEHKIVSGVVDTGVVDPM